MTVFRQFIVKVHSRCNLACNHCYVYEAVDQSWRNQPKAMSSETVKVVAESISRYAVKHGLTEVEVVLHGGEPLLLGPERMQQLIHELKATISPATRLRLGLQTNGVRLDQKWADLFLTEQVRVGISLDGGRTANDRHRLYRNGASSYQAAVRAVNLLRSPRHQSIFAGLLCTIDVDNDPARAQAYNVRSMPTVVLMRDGKEVGRFVGARSQTFVSGMLDRVVRGDVAIASP